MKSSETIHSNILLTLIVSLALSIHASAQNGSAQEIVAAKVSQLALLPQGRVEAKQRAKAMVAKMDELGFGNCTNTGACAAKCPKSVSLAHIARLNLEFLAAKFSD